MLQCGSVKDAQVRTILGMHIQTYLNPIRTASAMLGRFDPFETIEERLRQFINSVLDDHLQVLETKMLQLYFTFISKTPTKST